MKIQWGALVAFILLLCPFGAEAEILSVNTPGGTTHAGDSIEITITVDNSQAIAGTAFTLIYATDVFQLTGIESAFFDTFSNQWALLNPVPNPLPPANVTVDEQIHSRPLLSNTANGGTMVAAIRVQSGGTGTTLFTLAFDIAADAPLGLYPITIQPTSLNNVSAGYPSEGVQSPVLIGAVEGETDPTLAYPVIPTSLVSSSIVLSMLDEDGDGIDDNWERDTFGNLTTATATSDFDNDGYSDKQEYLHQLSGYTDSNDAVFNPKEKNAPNGIGYVGKNFLPTIYQLLLNGDTE